MIKQLETQLFFDLSKLDTPVRLPGNIFDLLGKPLQRWLQDLLYKLKASDEPTILSKNVSPKAHIEGAVYISEEALVEPFAFIKGPAFIGAGAEIRQGAYLRGHCYIGPHAVVGHTTEVKGSIFFNHAKAGHFAYVGDSILGINVNLGAGTKLANLKFNGSDITYKHPSTQEKLSSGLRKWGAILGDDAQTGCNAVLDPGTLLLPKTAVLPCVHYKGTLLSGIARAR